MTTRLFGAILAVATLVCGSASAQQTASLSAGFLPDPVTFDVYSGGENDAANIGAPSNAGSACVGRVARNADVALTFNSNGGPLNIGVFSAGDVSLIINVAGRWYCADDSYGLNPALLWSRAPSGRYYIWVGAVSDPIMSTVVITEGALN